MKKTAALFIALFIFTSSVIQVVNAQTEESKNYLRLYNQFIRNLDKQRLEQEAGTTNEEQAAMPGTPSVEMKDKPDVPKTGEFSITGKIYRNDQGAYFIRPEGKENGQGGTNFIYISVITADNKSEEGEIYNFNEKNYQALIKLKVGESISLGDKNQPNLNQWFTYKRLEDVEIGGNTSLVFENNKPWEFPSGTSETLFIFTKNDTICLLGFYTGGEVEKTLSIDSEVARSVIKSLQLK